MNKNYARAYDWNIICQVCRQKIKGSEAKKRWDGLIVCNEDFETRHPLDMPVKRQGEDTSVPFTSSEPVDTETTLTLDSHADTTGVPVGTFDINNKTI